MTDSGLLVLDTNVVVNLARGKATGETLDKAYGLRARPDRPLISIVSVGELFSFAAQFGWGRGKTEALKRLIEELVVVDIRNQTVLEKYAAIDAFLIKKGRRIGDNDLWIAATTAAAGAVLLTSDKDFDPLHDVFLTRIYFDPAVS